MDSSDQIKMIYGYIRVSTDQQDVANQKMGIIQKAQKMGFEITDWISDEGVSGTKEPDKRELGKLLRKINSGDIIIASEISRLGRSLFMIMRILEQCMNTGVKVYTVKDNYELGDNITSKVLAFAFGLAAEIEREMISKRTSEALQRRKSEGMILGRPVGRRSGSKKCDKLRDDIIKMTELGLSVSRIAKNLKVHRLTLSAFIKENSLQANHSSFGKSYSKAHAFRDVISIGLHSGLRYEQILEKIKSDYGGDCSIHSIKSYISNDEELHDILETKHDEIRIKANGGLKVHKKLSH